MENGGRVGVDRLVTESIVVNSINRIIGDLTILVSAQSTTTSIEIMVRDNIAYCHCPNNEAQHDAMMLLLLCRLIQLL